VQELARMTAVEPTLSLLQLLRNRVDWGLVLIRLTREPNRPSLRSLTCDIETSTLRLRTIEGHIRAGNVILIVDI
jgi:hypothetical protein